MKAFELKNVLNWWAEWLHKNGRKNVVIQEEKPVQKYETAETLFERTF